ncbi:MAG: cell filamentation protein Fic [Caldithrix sp.]|nr:MAG: cell filamentation protein Fic [Caldithrix sp.]
MAKPAEKLAESLEILHKLQKSGAIAIRSANLTRTHRERLIKNGFLQEVIKGWYVPSRPDETTGESTTWYASYWGFCASYLKYRFRNDWCLSPEQSISIHVENWTVPKQLLVRSSAAQNNTTALPHETSLVDVRATVPKGKDIEVKEGLKVFSLSSALIESSPRYFINASTDVRAALSKIRDASEVLERLLEGGHSIIAGRLAGAFRNIGRDRIAEDIVETMRTAGYDVRESDPFEHTAPVFLTGRDISTYVGRIQLMWQEMRDQVMEIFPESPGIPDKKEEYLKSVEDIYVTDAYHSLSIEGYRVSPELIERVRSGQWNPDSNSEDMESRDTLAARGYWQASKAVITSVDKILKGSNPGNTVDKDHSTWYREMFAPSVTVGILGPADLAGYRNDRVFIRKSMHVPPSSEAVRDAMPAFFELLQNEQEPSVRVVLGHWVFVYVHPYMDGNGRMGRFLMNTMLASGGFPWTVIPVEERDEYMSSLEFASVHNDIKPFAKFLAKLVSSRQKSD